MRVRRKVVGEGDRPAGVTRFHSFYAELVLSDVGNLFGWL